MAKDRTLPLFRVALALFTVEGVCSGDGALRLDAIAGEASVAVLAGAFCLVDWSEDGRGRRKPLVNCVHMLAKPADCAHAGATLHVACCCGSPSVSMLVLSFSVCEPSITLRLTPEVGTPQLAANEERTCWLTLGTGGKAGKANMECSCCITKLR